MSSDSRRGFTEYLAACEPYLMEAFGRDAETCTTHLETHDSSLSVGSRAFSNETRAEERLSLVMNRTDEMDRGFRPEPG